MTDKTLPDVSLVEYGQRAEVQGDAALDLRRRTISWRFSNDRVDV